MKCVSLALAFFCFFLALSVPLQAQVSFFQPLTFPDCPYGPLFVADFNGDGKPDLLCANGVLDLGNGDGTFKAGASFSGVALAVADFNGDGKPDLLEEGTNTFSVLLGNGDGTFQAAMTTATGGTLGALSTSDLNGDGNADVVGTFGAVLYVFLSNGDGSFKPGVPYALGTSSVFTGTLSFGDFNGDGKKDIALNISASGTNGQVITLLGNGDGTFQAPKPSTGAPNLYEPGKTIVGDFNGDGKPDLAVSDVCSGCIVPSYVYVQLGNGDGTFQPPTGIFPSPSPIGVYGAIGTFAAADLNGDGKLDLVFPDSFNQTPGGTFSLIYLGNGDGTFSAPSSYVSSFPVGNSGNPSDGSVVIADFNLDGKLDIASSGGILLGNGDGTFQGIPLATLSQEVSSATISDFEKNGKPDVAAVSSSYVYILHNNGSRVFSLLHTYSLTAPGFQILVGDLNGDGNLDLVVIQDGPAGYSVLLGNGDGSFQSPIFYAESASFGIATLVDVNNDKKLDLIEAGTNVPVGVSLGNGDGTFATTVTYDALSPWGTTLITGDFSGHGKVDIGVSPPYQTPGTVMLYGNGDGTFQPAIIPVALNGYTAFATADFRNIGRADLFDGLTVALNNGDGTFTFLPHPKYGGYLGDINGDGKIDILIPNTNQGPSSCQTAVELGNGDGTFGTPFNVPPNGCLPFSVSPNGYANIADMNGDGKPDIVFLWGSEVGVLLNTTAALDFSIAAASGSATSQTVTAGQTASFTLTFAPVGSFTGTVSLSCAITPVVTPAPTCSLSSSSVQISGSGTQNVTVKVGTTAPVTSSAAPHTTFPTGPMPLTWALILLASAWVGLRSRKRLPVFAAPIVLLGFVFLVGCGASGSSSTTHTTPGTPAGTYTATVTASSGSTSHNLALQVIVQ